MAEAVAAWEPQRAGLAESALADLRKTFDGELIGPADPAYDVARRAWNGMIDKYPAVVVQPRGTADVAAAVRFARKHELELSVRCGGHGTSGQSVTDGGLVVDLALMRAVRVDPAARRAWVQGGCLLRDVDREAQLHGLATTGGVVSTGRSYVNTLDDATTDKVRAAFGDRTYERLVAVKDRYDPDNVFHLNQNVQPSGRQGSPALTAVVA